MAVVVVVVLVAGGIVFLRHRASQYFVYSPGSAPQLVTDATCRAASSSDNLALPGGSPCARVSVPADRAHPVEGRLYMVDVLVGQATWPQYALAKLGLLKRFEQGTQLVPAEAVLGGTPASQLTCQTNQQMVGATEAASVAALRRLGYSVKENNLGALVATVAPNTAAERGGVECNDLITGFDGKPVHTADDLRAAENDAKPGQRVSLTVERVGKGGKTDTVTLHPTLTGTPSLGGAPAQPDRPFLGVAIQSRVTFTLPFHVQFDVGSIGGPSAGLAMTLALLDVLSNGKLTGGHKVAATGTIDTDGNVGDVGGVAQKTVAVRRAGVQLFLVPRQELAVARSEAGSSLKVEAVSTLNQALADLGAFGGDLSALPPPSRSS
ncbi:MAG: PDZ domain-containing protein [Acidimicrobiaceae bacterium]|nr:PDZ domain-containing protein [Acidimicrobiaceae bacterium]